MKKLLPAILFIHSLSFAQPGPDSGHSLVFSNASTNRVNIPDAVSFDHPDNNITIEAWVFPTAYGVSGGGGMIFSKLETDGTNEYYICLLSSGLLRFILSDNSAAYYYTVSTTTIPLNTWTHVAATYSFSTGIAQIYFNGILNVSNNIGSIILNSTAIRPMIGSYWLSNNNVSRAHFDGTIDEVRLWHIERTQTEMRDNMCRTLSPPLANLIAYYRLDETSGTFANDASGNGNNGTLENFTAGQIAARNFSGAPIGNQSINTYPAASPMILASASAGKLTIDNITGSPTGFHVFRVDAKPSQTAGLANPINTYFGTFVVGGSSPTYRTTYNYSGTAFNNSYCEKNYNLHQRTDNSISTWNLFNNTLDTVSNTLITANANSSDRKEIILDTSICVIPCTNHAPSAVNDFPPCITVNDSTKINVLANDSDPDGDSLLVSVLSVKHGTAQVLSNKQIKYIPNSGFTGNDTIQYIISDTSCFPLSDTAFAVICVNVVITPCTNHAPSAVNDFVSTCIDLCSNASVNILANDSDPDGDPVYASIIKVLHGSVVLSPNKTVQYTPRS
jgi:hypothetical protein